MISVGKLLLGTMIITGYGMGWGYPWLAWFAACFLTLWDISVEAAGTGTKHLSIEVKDLGLLFAGQLRQMVRRIPKPSPEEEEYDEEDEADNGPHRNLSKK